MLVAVVGIIRLSMTSIIQNVDAINSNATFANPQSIISSDLMDELMKNKYLITGSLTQKQIIEVEKNSSAFMAACYSRVIDNSMDPGQGTYL